MRPLKNYKVVCVLCAPLPQLHPGFMLLGLSTHAVRCTNGWKTDNGRLEAIDISDRLQTNQLQVRSTLTLIVQGCPLQIYCEKLYNTDSRDSLILTCHCASETQTNHT